MLSTGHLAGAHKQVYPARTAVSRRPTAFSSAPTSPTAGLLGIRASTALWAGLAAEGEGDNSGPPVPAGGAMSWHAAGRGTQRQLLEPMAGHRACSGGNSHWPGWVPRSDARRTHMGSLTPEARKQLPSWSQGCDYDCGCEGRPGGRLTCGGWRQRCERRCGPGRAHGRDDRSRERCDRHWTEHTAAGHDHSPAQSTTLTKLMSAETTVRWDCHCTATRWRIITCLLQAAAFHRGRLPVTVTGPLPATVPQTRSLISNSNSVDCVKCHRQPGLSAVSANAGKQPLGGSQGAAEVS